MSIANFTIRIIQPLVTPLNTIKCTLSHNICTTSHPSNYLITTASPVPLSTALSLQTPADIGELYEKITTDNKAIYEFDNVCNCYIDQQEFYQHTLKECSRTFENTLIIIHCNESDNTDYTMFGKPNSRGLIYRLADDLLQRQQVYISSRAYYDTKSYPLVKINKQGKAITRFEIKCVEDLEAYINESQKALKEYCCVKYTLSTDGLMKRDFLLLKSYIEEIPLQLIRYATHRVGDDSTHLGKYLSTVTTKNNYIIYYIVGVSPMGHSFEQDSQLLERIHKLRKDLNTIFNQHQQELDTLGFNQEDYEPFIPKPAMHSSVVQPRPNKFNELVKQLDDVEHIIKELTEKENTENCDVNIN